MIPDRVKDAFCACKIVYFATASSEGEPNAVPIYWKKISDDRILLLDNYMNETLENLLENKKVCVSFFESDRGESYKIKGLAEYHTQGEVFEEGSALMRNKDPKGVVEIKVSGVFSLKSGSDSKKNLY